MIVAYRVLGRIGVVMADHVAVRTPLAEKASSKSKPSVNKTGSHVSGIGVVPVSPNENCSPSVAASQRQDGSTTIDSLKKECDALRRTLQLLEAEREEEQQGILRARAALEEKEYQVRHFAESSDCIALDDRKQHFCHHQRHYFVS